MSRSESDKIYYVNSEHNGYVWEYGIRGSNPDKKGKLVLLEEPGAGNEGGCMIVFTSWVVLFTRFFTLIIYNNNNDLQNYN